VSAERCDGIVQLIYLVKLQEHNPCKAQHSQNAFQSVQQSYNHVYQCVLLVAWCMRLIFVVYDMIKKYDFGLKCSNQFAFYFLLL